MYKPSFPIFVPLKTLPGYIHIILLFCALTAKGQNEDRNFRNTQLAAPHVAAAWKEYNHILSDNFSKKNVAYPPKELFLRAFKSQNELELWARSKAGSPFTLIKTYRICAVSGTLGPKRGEGDRQIPEGFYFIEQFNTNSDYYLALLLNYPNYSDRLMSARPKVGGDIYIHGGCVTIGCLPMTDEGIKELYTVCLNARLNGQENIPVHIYPTRLNKNGMTYLKKAYPNDMEKQKFWLSMKGSYDYFEKSHKLLPVIYVPGGAYVN